jgi:hypothetical protein
MTDMTPDARPATFTLRLTPENRLRLERDAGGMSIGAYIRWRVFDPDKPPPRHRGQFPVKDHQALSRTLAALGQSRIANNLNQIAVSIHTGAIDMTPEVEADLIEAIRHIAEMRRMLVEALGLDGER